MVAHQEAELRSHGSRVPRALILCTTAVAGLTCAGAAAPPDLSVQLFPILRVHVFVDDEAQDPRDAWELEIRSGGSPVSLQWVGEDGAIIGKVSATCSLSFRTGDNEAEFEEIDHRLLMRGGELLIAFVTTPALLDRDVSLREPERTPPVDPFVASSYDHARSLVASGWKQISAQDRQRVRRAAFYQLTPYTPEGDPVVETGYSFEPMDP